LNRDIRGSEYQIMSETRKSVDCDYCGDSFVVRYSGEITPEFCCFCGEPFEGLTEVVEDDDDELEEDDETEDEESDF